MNGTRRIIVEPPADLNITEFPELARKFPKAVVPGLSADDTAALLSTFPEFQKTFNDKAKPPTFTLPSVLLGTIVPITPGPESTPLPDNIKNIIFPKSKPKPK
jgi:hypothetical protein